MIAIIPKSIANKGIKFQFLGLIDECKKCSLNNVCKNLIKNKIYFVKSIKDRTFNCKISGDAIACEVEESSFETIIDKRKAIEGASIKIKKEICKEFNCKYFSYCNNILEGNFVVERVLNNVECKKGYDLVRVLLK